MSKNNYYFIARNISTNKVKAIPLNGRFGVRLEEVDLLTTRYDNPFALKDDLFCNGLIDSFNTDLFLVHSFQGNVYCSELLFNNRDEIGVIAESYLNGRDDETLEKRDSILNNFCRKMGDNSDYYDFVTYGFHNISPKFVYYFHDSRYRKMYENKFRQGGWARNSYSLIHNILESYDRFETKKSHAEDYYARDKVKEVLLEITDSNLSYYEGTLFDLLDSEDKDKPKVKKKKPGESRLEPVSSEEIRKTAEVMEKTPERISEYSKHNRIYLDELDLDEEEYSFFD